MILYYILFLTLAFDFKGVEDGGGTFQIAIILITLLVAGVIVIKSKFQQSDVKSEFFDFILPIYLLLSLIVATFQGVEFDRFIRVAFPYVFLVIGFAVGRTILQDIGFRKFNALALTGSLVAMFFTVIFGFISTGAAMQDIRHQILSPMIYIAMPLLALNVFVLRKNILISITLLLVILYLIILSATRSWLLAFAGVMLLGAFFKDFSTESFSKSVAYGSARFSLILAASILAIYVASPETVDRMIERFLSSNSVGFDITTATRLAEIDFQINDWLQDTTSFIFGKGLGASYSFGGEHLEYLYVTLGHEGVAIDWWFAGHNFWIYSLFSHGIFLGWILPFSIIYLLFKNFKELMLTKVVKTTHPHAIIISTMVTLVISSVLLSTIGGNALGHRMLSLYVGIFLGIASTNISRKIKPQPTNF